MNKNLTKERWTNYRDNELKKLAPILKDIGFDLADNQVHTIGERHLMSGFKLVLNANNIQSQKKVIIKASSHADGAKEIEHEHAARQIIKNIEFAYRDFLLPQEILFLKINKFTISISSFIEQDKSFLEHSLEEQFFLTLRALEMQEGTHLTTRSHVKKVNKFFGIVRASDYQNEISDFQKTILHNNPQNAELKNVLNRAIDFFNSNLNKLEQYTDFLTHTDFVPHNIRVVNRDLYLLDFSSIHFGNKYESWARFINFLSIYNQELETALSNYVKNNRETDEYLNLRLMRLFKLCFLLDFYSKALLTTSGNLLELTKLRIRFWTKVLSVLLDDKFLNKQIVAEYKKERDALRSTDEIIRQKNLKQLL